MEFWKAVNKIQTQQKMKNYKLTEETINVYGRTLYRIEAIVEFKNITVGEKGGFIESEKNLSAMHGFSAMHY
jgi:hypothetical protein